jgi:hypothetical protein
LRRSLKHRLVRDSVVLPHDGDRMVTCDVLVTSRSDIGSESGLPGRLSQHRSRTGSGSESEGKVGNFLLLSMISLFSQEPVPRHRCLGAKEKARRLVGRACV